MILLRTPPNMAECIPHPRLQAQGKTALAQELIDSGADTMRGLTLQVGPMTYSESPLCFLMTSQAPGALGPRDVASALVRAGGAGHQSLDCFGMPVRKRSALEVAERQKDEVVASLIDASHEAGADAGARRSLRYRGKQYSSSLMRFLFAKEDKGQAAGGAKEGECGKECEGMEPYVDWFECYFVQGRGGSCATPKGMNDKKDSSLQAMVNTSLSDRLYGGATLQQFVAARIASEGSKTTGACDADAPDGPLKELHADF